MPRRKISTTIYLEPNQLNRLNDLRKALDVPVAVMIRWGVDRAIERYERLERQQKGNA